MDTYRPNMLDEYIVGFLNHDPLEAKRFYDHFRPYCLKLVGRMAPRLPSDLREDVLSQTLLNLCSTPAESFDPQRGSASAFLKGHIQNGLRQVSAQYCPPGRPTRYRKDGNGGSDKKNVPPPVISLNDFIETTERRKTARMIHKDFDASCDAATVLHLAPKRVSTALESIYLLGHSLAETAEELGVSRFKLHREIETFAKQLAA